MKKRVLSALLVLCMACSMVSTVWANQATPETADEPQPASAEVTIATPESAAPAEDPAPAQTPAETVAYTAVAEQEGQPVNVIVDVPVGAFDETVTPVLHADAVSQAEADQAAETVADQTGAAFDGMMVLDVYFTDGDNTEEIEPALPVSVRFELPEAALPEDVDASSLTVHHLAEEKDEAGNTVTDENGEAVVNVETVATATTTDDVAGVIALSTTAAEKTAAGEEVARIEDLPELQAEVAANNAEEPGVVAAFEIEGFSVFTITYNNTNSGNEYGADLTVYRINQDGTGIGDDFTIDTTPGNLTVDVQTVGRDNEPVGYTFEKAVVAYDVNSALQSDSEGISQISWNNTEKRWRYREIDSYNMTSLQEGQQIYFIYNTDSELTIDDSQLLTTGNLLPQYDTDGSTALVYEWERKAENSDSFETVERVAVTEVNGQNLYNVAADGSSLNVTLDGGARYTYRVRLIQRGDDDVRDENIISPEYKVPYYDELQNGTFETPSYTDGGQHFIASGSTGVVWKTTGQSGTYGSRIELVGNKQYDWHGVNYCPPGEDDDSETGSNQSAELNADSAGALYQDVLTTPGSTMYWSLMHNGRTKNGADTYVGYGQNYDEDNPASDTMYVLIMPTDMAEEQGIDTQDEVQNVLDNLDDYAGASVTTITYQWYWTRSGSSGWPWEDDNYTYTLHVRSGQSEPNSDIVEYSDWTEIQSESSGDLEGQVKTYWANHTGSYYVNPDQYMTRYFFVAGDTELGRYTGGQTEPYSVGNHIDNVFFSTTVPEPADGTATLIIEKTIAGLTSADYEKLKEQLTFDVQYGTNNLTLGANDSGWDWQGTVNEGTGVGEWIGRYVIQNIPVPANSNVSYDVEENVETAVIEGYELTQDADIAAKTGDLTDGESETAVFTNTYESIAPDTVKLTLQKTFVGLTDAEVNYLLFGQGDDGFGWDINYCQPEVRVDSKLQDGETVEFATYMADGDAVKGITLPDGTEVTGGGDFRITAQQFLSKTGTYGSDFTETGLINIDEIENQEQGYTNQITHASLKKEFGNWVYSVTLEVPAVEDGYYYTVFEQHGEVPGYAKLDDSNVEYAITGIEGLTGGTGKFIDTEANNVYVDMDDEVEPVKVTVNDEDYTLDGEEAAIHQGVFQKLYITNDATIEFTNHYTGNLKVSKTVTGVDEADLNSAELAGIEFTITLQPYDGIADLGLLHGRKIEYTIMHKDGSMTEDDQIMDQEKGCAIEVTLKYGDTITFEEIPAIQYIVTEKDPEASAYDFLDYTWQEATYAETMTGFGDEQKADEHWNHNGQSASIPAEEGGRRYYTVIGTDEPGDRIVSVDSMISIKPEDVRPVETLQITNKYVAYKSLTIEKDVTGNLSDPDDTFTFTISGATGIKPENITNSGAENVNVSNGTITATLGNGDTITIDKLTSEHTLTISEDAGDYDTVIDLTETDGYVDGTDHDGFAVNSKQVTVTVADVTDEEANGASLGTVRFENKKSVTPPTGLESNHTRPYTLMVTAAGIAGLALIGAIVNRCIRRRREE